MTGGRMQGELPYAYPARFAGMGNIPINTSSEPALIWYQGL